MSNLTGDSIHLNMDAGHENVGIIIIDTLFLILFLEHVERGVVNTANSISWIFNIIIINSYKKKISAQHKSWGHAIYFF